MTISHTEGERSGKGVAGREGGREGRAGGQEGESDE